MVIIVRTYDDGRAKIALWNNPQVSFQDVLQWRCGEVLSSA